MQNPSLKLLLPRFHDDAHTWLSAHYPEFAAQLDQLVVTDRCSCGEPACVQFYCETRDPARAPLSGRRPMYCQMEGAVGFALFGHSDGVLTGFTVLGDYEDGYLASRLALCGSAASGARSGAGSGAAIAPAG